MSTAKQLDYPEWYWKRVYQLSLEIKADADTAYKLARKKADEELSQLRLALEIKEG